MKVQIIGYSGSGKSTFAEKIGAFYNIAPTYFDQLHFSDHWQTNEDQQIINDVNEILKQDNWIIDGNYNRFLGSKRNDDADIIFFFKFNRFRCLLNAIKRRIKYHKKVRPSAPKNSVEKFDWEFFWWIMLHGRTKRIRQRYKEICKTHKDKVIIFSNHKQVNHYIDGLKIK